MQNQTLAIAIIALTFDDVGVRNEILGIPLLYGTFSTLYSALICFILFRCFGITAAAKGLTIIQAWKLSKSKTI